VKPAVPTSAMRNARSLLGTFTTSFSCCEPRVTNIQRIAKTVDGTVVAPGEQFSLNGVAGERTRAKGYKPAPTIGDNNELVDSVGGGVSQFSTTLYNAAYFAGLQIDAHTPHSFYIDRYPPGRESTLSFGSIDLLWTNDTGAPVVVRSSASDTAVTASIYGGSDVREVRAETRSRSGNGQGGFDISIDRVVVDDDGPRDPEGYTTSYGRPAE
jgi:vancomycin resistance protein YoaR